MLYLNICHSAKKVRGVEVSWPVSPFSRAGSSSSSVSRSINTGCSSSTEHNKEVDWKTFVEYGEMKGALSIEFRRLLSPQSNDVSCGQRGEMSGLELKSDNRDYLTAGAYLTVNAASTDTLTRTN